MYAASQVQMTLGFDLSLTQVVPFLVHLNCFPFAKYVVGQQARRLASHAPDPRFWSHPSLRGVSEVKLSNTSRKMVTKRCTSLKEL